MALEHAILVSLSEHSASGLDLARRFDRSIGFFWSATHQQIYRVLARMEADGWVSVTTVAQESRPAKKVYDVAPAGAEQLRSWLAETPPVEPFRSDIAVRLRGASYGDRASVLETVRRQLADHHAKLDHYEHLSARDFPDPSVLSGQPLDVYLVLRGGIHLERFWVTWLTEVLTTYGHPVSLPDVDRKAPTR